MVEGVAVLTSQESDEGEGDGTHPREGQERAGHPGGGVIQPAAPPRSEQNMCRSLVGSDKFSSCMEWGALFNCS